MFIINNTLQRSEDLAVSNIAVKIDETVREMKGSIDKLMPSHKDLMFNVKRDLIDTLTERATTTVETQTRSKLLCCHNDNLLADITSLQKYKLKTQES